MTNRLGIIFNEMALDATVHTEGDFLFVISMNDMKNAYDTSPWYVIHTFNCYELKIGDFLRQKNLVYFIPMEYRVKELKGGKIKKKLVPVIHNLLFVQKSMPEKKMKQMFTECSLPVYFQCKENSGEYYEIRHREMQLFMLMCDQSQEYCLSYRKPTYGHERQR